MARYRYQEGTVKKRGKVWVGIYREDVILPNGDRKRIQKKPVLGTIKEIPTERLAKRVLADRFLAEINDPGYRARPMATFSEFAERWKASVLPNHAASSQPSERSDISAWVKTLGTVPLRDIGNEMVQTVVTGWSKTQVGREGDRRFTSPKTIQNRLATFKVMWNSAKAWKYVAHTPHDGVLLPDYCPEEQPHFTKQEVMNIMAASKPPYDTIWRLIAETGIRRGEVCGLNVGHVDLDNLIITIRKSRWGKHVGNTKSRKPRIFELSPELGDRLRQFMDGRGADQPLFLTPGRVTKEGKQIGGGCRLHPENLVKRVLKPILAKLGLEGGTHAFRHGNATVLDELNVPMKVRQERLGHANSRTTMGYTHRSSETGRAVAEALGKMYSQAVN